MKPHTKKSWDNTELFIHVFFFYSKESIHSVIWFKDNYISLQQEITIAGLNQF